MSISSDFSDFYGKIWRYRGVQIWYYRKYLVRFGNAATAKMVKGWVRWGGCRSRGLRGLGAVRVGSLHYLSGERWACLKCDVLNSEA